MTTLRTPQARFTNLPGFGYTPQYRQHLGLRVAYVDEGPRDAAVTALCLHGNPSWSYLYRHMIPVFTAAGVRVVAPDLIGFGRSDKFATEAEHSFAFHRDMLLAFVEQLDLKNVMLVCQDWGGIFGLTLPMAAAHRFSRLLVMNTAIATGQLGEGFLQWRVYSNSQPDLPVGKLLARGKRDMTPAEVAAYDAPFPDASYKAALRAFASTGREAEGFWREQWAGDSFMAIGMLDPVLGPAAMHALRKTIRNCPAPMAVAEGGHFVQEWGAPIAAAALAHFKL
jgi:haloalkane dehalogenase